MAIRQQWTVDGSCHGNAPLMPATPAAPLLYFDKRAQDHDGQKMDATDSTHTTTRIASGQWSKRV